MDQAGGSASGGGVTAPARNKTRAKRGQVTKQKSLDKRKRVGGIREGMKNLQGILHIEDEEDEVLMVDEAIDYVKFLEVQTKVLDMGTSGGASDVVPHTAAISFEGEDEVAKLIGKKDIGKLRDFCKKKGLGLIPSSLAPAKDSASSSKP